MDIPTQIVTFWLDEVGPQGWYLMDDALDQNIRAQFLSVWEDSREGGCGLWLTDPQGALAYIILTDQFSRNMFRGDATAFATDKSARAVAKAAIDRDWDRATPEPARQFFYLPLMHSENLGDQDRAVRLIHARMPDTGASTLQHAKVHRTIIRDFGRFPFVMQRLGAQRPKPNRCFWMLAATVRRFVQQHNLCEKMRWLRDG